MYFQQQNSWFGCPSDQCKPSNQVWAKPCFPANLYMAWIGSSASSCFFLYSACTVSMAIVCEPSFHILSPKLPRFRNILKSSLRLGEEATDSYTNSSVGDSTGEATAPEAPVPWSSSPEARLMLLNPSPLSWSYATQLLEKRPRQLHFSAVDLPPH